MRARAANARAGFPRSYWDFATTRHAVTKPRPEPTGTPPVHCIMQVAEALRMIHEEGVEAVFRRHATMAAATHAAMTELGLAHQCPSLTGRSATVTVTSRVWPSRTSVTLARCPGRRLLTRAR